MTKNDVAAFMDRVVFARLRELCSAGQREYADGDSTAFSNFEKLSRELGISREAVLWTYAMKHKDGIASWLRGHRSQREDVRGRIADLMVYLCLLWAMIEDGAQEQLVRDPGATARILDDIIRERNAAIEKRTTVQAKWDGARTPQVTYKAPESI